MTRKKYINSNCPVYLSYAWANDENPFIERDVELVCELLENNNILYKRDKEDEGNSLCDVEDEFDDYSAIIVVISERYIKSLYCMYEWHLIRKNDKIRDKIITVVCEDANISNENVFKKHLMWFTDRKDALQNKKKGNIIPLTEVESYAFEANFFIDDLIDLKDNYIPKAYNLRKDNYASIISRIRLFIKRIDNNCDYTQTLVPHFSFPIPGHLIARENEENALFESLTQNRIVNLVGIGGSGKSSLAVLCLKKHGNNFNEIVYITVNKNIEEDFVEQTNKTLKLNFERNRFDETIAFLQENYKSEQPNLLVLDINETSDKDKNDATINLIIQNNVILEGWKFLILSRENIDTRNRIAAYNLNGKEDFDFLKKLFLDKAGARYNDFGDFVGLFNVIYYNPLLAEQLGWYLNYYPKTATLDDIKKILYGSLVEQKMQGISAAQRHGENVNTFLRNLIVYDKLAKIEQKLLSHFVLWQSEYIRYDVIADLLTGVFASEYELIETLTSLTKSSILATNNEETLSYKLHGLLADSLREQINIENEDYDQYLWNIDRIIEYGYYKFVPFADCIGNSLCEHNISNDYVRLWKTALKFYNTWKNDYSKLLYNKVIKILLNKIASSKDNPEYQNDLALAYNDLATLQQNHLGDYNSAKSNYEQAIAIQEQLPKDNPEYQNDLATTYHRLAYLQIMHLGDYSSAESNNQKAIIIGEQLPNDKPEYQNNLADAYYNLALLQQVHLCDYDSAKSNYEKSIAIREQLPKDNPEYQNDLARAYNNLANLQSDHLGDYDSAKVNYEKAIAIREQLPKDNPKYQNFLANTYNNLAILQQNHLGEYELSKSNYEKAIAIREQLPKDNPEYQNGLARAYNSLAYLQQYHLGDYDSAKSNYEKAIAIREQLPKDNPEYQNGLASAYNNLAYCYKAQKQYTEAITAVNNAIAITKQLSDNDAKYLPDWINHNHSLAEIYFDNNGITKAKDILVQIQPMAKKCLDEKPNDSWTQELNVAIADLLSKIGN